MKSPINQINNKKLNDMIDVMVRKIVRTAALIVLSYLAWRGASDLVSASSAFRTSAAVVAVIGLLGLYELI